MPAASPSATWTITRCACERYASRPLLTVVSVTGCNPFGVRGGRSLKLIGAYAGDDRCGDLRQLAKEDR